MDDFSGALMTSRWYRAVGCLGRLTGDHDLVASDMDRWLGIAGDLVGDDEHTRIIAADNYFQAGQCHEELGHVDEAVECYRRSLAHSPSGVTPVRRVRDLHARGALGASADVVLAWARQQPAWSSLT